MRLVDFIVEQNRRDWIEETREMIKEAVKEAEKLLSRSLQFRDAELRYDGKWYVVLRDGGRWPSVSFTQPHDATQEWYTNEIVRQLQE